jgi:hypothetical protein
MELMLYRYGLDTWDDWDYLVHISPSTLILRPVDALAEFFNSTGADLHLQVFPGSDMYWPNARELCVVQCKGTAYRLSTESTCVSVRVCRVKKNETKQNLPPWCAIWTDDDVLIQQDGMAVQRWATHFKSASQWKAMSRRLVDYLFKDEHARTVLLESWQYFRTVEIGMTFVII